MSRDSIKSPIGQMRLIDMINNYMALVEKQNNKQTLSAEKKEKIDHGLCRGFSIVHSYMAAKGMSAWWESVLQIIAEWDGKEASLDNPVLKMPAGSRGSIYGNDKKITYRELLVRVTNYVVYNYGKDKVSGVPNINQEDFLREKGPFVSEDGGIQFHRSFCGYFDEGRLNALLNNMKQTPAVEAILSVISNRHACSFRYDSGSDRWFLYDPNYEKGEKRFTQKELMAEILENPQRFLGHNLSVEVASWKTASEQVALKKLETYTPEFYSKNNIPSLLNESGLHMMARFAPDQLTNIIKVASADVIVKNSLAEALKAKNKLNSTGLHAIARSKQLAGIVEIAEKDEGVRNSLAEAIKVRDDTGSIGLLSIAIHAPKEFARIVKIAEEDEAVRNSLAEAIKLKNHKGWIGLLGIAELAPLQLAGVIKVVNDNVTVTNCLVEMLKTEREDNTGLHIIAQYIPDQLAGIVEMAKTDPAVRNSLAKALKAKDSHGWTGLHMIAAYAPEALVGIIEMAQSDPVVRNSMAVALKTKDKYGQTDFDRVKIVAPEKESAINDINKLVEEESKIIKAFFDKHPHGFNSYWKGKDQKTIQMTEIIHHALGGNKRGFFGGYSGADTKKTLVELGVDLKMLNDTTMPLEKKSDAVVKSLIEKINQKNDSPSLKH